MLVVVHTWPPPMGVSPMRNPPEPKGRPRLYHHDEERYDAHDGRVCRAKSAVRRDNARRFPVVSFVALSNHQVNDIIRLPERVLSDNPRA
jgi:hypothetical protein